MGSLNDSRDRAEKLGRQAADIERDAAAGKGLSFMVGFRRERPSISVGALALGAFREHGTEGMRAVIRGYQAGYDGWTCGRVLPAWSEEEAA